TISNSVVKPLSADDSVGSPHVKVGHCQGFITKPPYLEKDKGVSHFDSLQIFSVNTPPFPLTLLLNRHNFCGTLPHKLEINI
ncbi:MAG: hypothetical protein PHP00_07185, partial [Thiotrichaceae bacterium]|nr:hypothetical protein [Thiotrichaceae bacterium]